MNNKIIKILLNRYQIKIKASNKNKLRVIILALKLNYSIQN